jgi:hypothetical protein
MGMGKGQGTPMPYHNASRIEMDRGVIITIRDASPSYVNARSPLAEVMDTRTAIAFAYASRLALKGAPWGMGTAPGTPRQGTAGQAWARHAMRLSYPVQPGARVGLKVARRGGILARMAALEALTLYAIAALVVVAIISRIGVTRVAAWVVVIIGGAVIALCIAFLFVAVSDAPPT